MFNLLSKFGWAAGSALLLCAAWSFYCRLVDVIPQEKAVILKASDEVDEAGLDGLVLDLDEPDPLPKSRDVFAFKSIPETMAAKKASVEIYRVSGLITGGKPGVVLEDLRAGQALFLSEGEVKGDLVLLKVRPEGAYVQVNGRELMLVAPSRAE